MIQSLMRELSDTEASRLGASQKHYRAYVGPPGQYDYMSGNQFSLLFLLGLREGHRVLDFGCGSLRVGRLLIPYLAKGHYFGIEPNEWLVQDALERQLGGMERIKEPTFSASTDFDAGVFGETFDFIIAQSIFSHSGPALTRKALTSFAAALAPGGLCVVTFLEGDQDTPEGWFYGGETPVGSVAYRPSLIENLVEEAGLKGVRLTWKHPRQVWWLLGRELPPQDELDLLVGRLP